ncbi:MAG: addiction module protein [Candidatus Thioglobus sp.]|nr:addiction module protein [Candidatus Thioglobus pontius]MBL6976938.1 addiction module protein [Candidatus Thioglobus sp.]MBL6984660.1 addiction module protein [Candidatus Thioglobus sp.]
MNTTALINEAVSLPIEDRTLVVESLLKSLNHPEEKIDDQWSKLATKRLKELQSGKVKAIDGVQVFNKIWKRFS